MIGDPALHQAIDLLAEWLPHQRWFAGKDPSVDAVRLVSATLINEAEPRVWHTLVEVTQGDRREIYQIPLTFRRGFVDRLEHVHIGQTDAGHVYDALHDKDATTALLQYFDGHTEVGDLRFHTEPGATVPFGEPSLALPVEQSNTSLAYGDVALLKVFRRIQPGLNPDVEVHDALTRAGSQVVAPLFGWIDGSWEAGSESGPRVAGGAAGAAAGGQDRHEASLAMLQAFLTTASDGWALATASVRDLYAEGDLRADEVGGDFAGEAFRLGAATAEVHRTMAEVLPTSELKADDLVALAEQMRRRLDEAVAVVPELEPHLPGLQAQLDAVTEVTHAVPAQRIHGDYHLGQVVRTVVGWKIVDFEGEPSRPLAERTALESPLRDIAGMLRSFDYAARHLLVTDYQPDHPSYEQIEFRAIEWAQRNRDAFCEGYARAAGFDPRDDQVLLCAYEADKAVYEVAYEARHRPAWISIPLAAVERLSGRS